MRHMSQTQTQTQTSTQIQTQTSAIEKYIEYVRSELNKIEDSISTGRAGIEEALEIAKYIVDAIERLKQDQVDTKLVKDYINIIEVRLTGIADFTRSFIKCIPSEDVDEDEDEDADEEDEDEKEDVYDSANKCIMNVLDNFLNFIENVYVAFDTLRKLREYLVEGIVMMNTPQELHWLQSLVMALRKCTSIAKRYADILRDGLADFAKVALLPYANILIEKASK